MTARFLADESCDFAAVRALRAGGFDVMAVVEHSPGATDDQVIALSVKEGRVLLPRTRTSVNSCSPRTVSRLACYSSAFRRVRGALWARASWKRFNGSRTASAERSWCCNRTARESRVFLLRPNTLRGKR